MTNQPTDPEPRKLPHQYTAEEKLAKLGTPKPPAFDKLLGAGQDLWETDEEFEEFLEHVARTRREGR